MTELRIPGLRNKSTGPELLDVAYTDHTRKAQYTAKFQDMGKTFKLRVTIEWSGPYYSNAYVELLNASHTWTRLADEPYESWGDAMQEAESKGPNGPAARKRILDEAAVRLFLRAQRIVEA